MFLWIFLSCISVFPSSSGLGVVLICRMPGGISSQPLQNGSVQPRDIVDIHIGNRSAVVSPSKAGTIDSLLTGDKQRATIKVHGKSIASFYFSFKDYGADTLCLWYDRGYGTWSMESMPSNHCKCKNIIRWNKSALDTVKTQKGK
jgi:hypothetical protein